MPTYDYLCRACGAEETHHQKINDAPKLKCEACGRRQLKRQIGKTSFFLSGGGWYADGYSQTTHETLESAKAADPGKGKK